MIYLLSVSSFAQVCSFFAMQFLQVMRVHDLHVQALLSAYASCSDSVHVQVVLHICRWCCTSPDHGTSQSPRCGLESSPSLFPWQQCSMFLNASWIQSDSERSHTFRLCSWLSSHHGSFLLLVTPLQTDLKQTNIICAETMQIPGLLLTSDILQKHVSFPFTLLDGYFPQLFRYFDMCLRGSDAYQCCLAP